MCEGELGGVAAVERTWASSDALCEPRDAATRKARALITRAGLLGTGLRIIACAAQ